MMPVPILLSHLGAVLECTRPWRRSGEASLLFYMLASSAVVCAACLPAASAERLREEGIFVALKALLGCVLVERKFFFVFFSVFGVTRAFFSVFSMRHGTPLRASGGIRSALCLLDQTRGNKLSFSLVALLRPAPTHNRVVTVSTVGLVLLFRCRF